MFTPVETANGAVLLHYASTTLLFDTGVVLGASGFIRRLLRSPLDDGGSVLYFFAGMVVATAFAAAYLPSSLPSFPAFNWEVTAVLWHIMSAVLIGWGTKVSTHQGSQHKYFVS
jgi:uncharacterized protein